ncbi:MAG: Flp family type IVb pilin [Phycisphaerae bacterium]
MPFEPSQNRLHADQAGQTSIEWALLLGAVGVPMIYVMVLLLGALCEHYRMVTFIETLPLP